MERALSSFFVIYKTVEGNKLMNKYFFYELFLIILYIINGLVVFEMSIFSFIYNTVKYIVAVADFVLLYIK